MEHMEHTNETNETTDKRTSREVLAEHEVGNALLEAIDKLMETDEPSEQFADTATQALGMAFTIYGLSRGFSPRVLLLYVAKAIEKYASPEREEHGASAP